MRPVARVLLLRAVIVTACVALALGAAMCVHLPRDPNEARLLHGTLDVGGRTRTFLFVEPDGVALKPLLVSLHGRLGTGETQARMTGFTSLALRDGFIAVFPDGVERSWADARRTTPAFEQGVDDVAFLSSLIDTFVREHHADPSRVYVVGLSNGGAMTLTLGCALSSRLAAIASVISGVPRALQQTCTLAKPLPVALVMGDEDGLMPFDGGEVIRHGGAVLGFSESLAFWAEKNHCPGEPEVSALPNTDPADGTTTTLTHWSSCAAEVRGYAVRGGGHTWPGGAPYMREFIVGKTSHDWSATEALWAFVRRFKRE